MSDIIMYTTDDGSTKIDVIYDEDTIWASQAQMAELFGKSKSTINEHITNIFEDEELTADSVIRKYRTTASDGKSYDTMYYSLDMVISVGYRVRSPRGVQFRIWANRVIKEYLQKGFAINDDLLKNAGGGNYFSELLGRIRDIRSSEKVFYRQVLDLFATSVDYNANSTEAQNFFQIIQNKMHWATHGHTASELILERVDSDKPYLGLSNFKGDMPTKSEAKIAKNYLDEKELNILNRLVSAYLDLAEIHAMRHEKMTMTDWVVQIDDFLTMTRSDILKNAGKVSALEASSKVEEEYAKYKVNQLNQLNSVERDFVKSINQTHKLLSKQEKQD